MNSDIQSYFETEENFWRSIRSDSLILEDGAAVATATGVNSKYLNAVSQKEPLRDPDRAFELAEEFFNKYSLPWTWVIRDDLCDKKFMASAQLHGFEEHDNVTAMACRLDDFFSVPNPTPTLNILECSQNLTLWGRPLKEAFGDTEACIHQYMQAHSRDHNHKVLHHYVGLFENHPVAALTLSFCNGKVRLDDVGTLPDFQGRGFATELLKHSLYVAKAHGAQFCYLDAPSQGLSIYEKLGFYHLFGLKIFCRRKFVNNIISP